METTYKILIIEDDEIVARTIERVLRGSTYHITLANSGVEGLKVARRDRPDLVILDVVMPGMDGYTVCQEMRADPILSNVPVLFLTAKSKDQDKITGFNAGADDYMSKPFNIDELVLRVQAILRRAKNTHAVQASVSAGVETAESPAEKTGARKGKSEIGYITTDEVRFLKIDGFILDTRSYELSLPKGVKVLLTPVQYDLLYHLMSHQGEIFSPSRLLDLVWNYPSDAGSPDLVRVHIKNLRERIETDPKNPTFIRTVPGYGYTIKLQDHE